MDRASPWLVSNALKRYRQPIVDYLICGLTDEDRWVQLMAARMLGNTGDPSVRDHLKPLLTSRDADLRQAAAESLAMLSSHTGNLTLTNLGSCNDCMIRFIADEAIQQLKAAR